MFYFFLPLFGILWWKYTQKKETEWDFASENNTVFCNGAANELIATLIFCFHWIIVYELSNTAYEH